MPLHRLPESEEELQALLAGAREEQRIADKVEVHELRLNLINGSQDTAAKSLSQLNLRVGELVSRQDRFESVTAAVASTVEKQTLSRREFWIATVTVLGAIGAVLLTHVRF